MRGSAGRRCFFLPRLLLKQSNPIGLAHGRFLKAGKLLLNRVEPAFVAGEQKLVTSAAGVGKLGIGFDRRAGRACTC